MRSLSKDVFLGNNGEGHLLISWAKTMPFFKLAIKLNTEILHSNSRKMYEA